MIGAEEVQRVAASLGIDLDEAEAALYVAPLTEELRAFDALLRVPDEVRRPERDPGHRPTHDEDPHGAWTWRCDISGATDGVLAGRTVGFKDHISVASIPQSFASSLFDGLVPDVDATVVTRVLAAGGRVVGKNTMSGFVSDRPPPLNPRSPGFSAGGSSSGSAVAVAAGEVDISFGGDQAGSVRVPAAYCGVVGLKPTFGLVSSYGVGFGSEPSLDHVGPIARSVDDVVVALAAVAGRDPRDPRQDQRIPERIEVTDVDAGVRGLRIGLLEEGFDEPIDPAVRDAVLAGADALAAAGAEVVWVSVPEHRRLDDVLAALLIEGAHHLFVTDFYGAGARTHYPTAVQTAVHRLWRDQADRLTPRAKLNHVIAAVSRARYDGAVYARAHNLRPRVVAAYDRALAEVDVVLMPTVRAPAEPVEPPPASRLGAVEASLARNIARLPWTYNTKPFNYTGHPAVALPCGSAGDLAVSAQLVGPVLGESLLLRAAKALEGALGGS